MTTEGQAQISGAPNIGGWLVLPALGLGFGWIGLLSGVGSVRMAVVEIVQANLLPEFPNARIFEKAVLAAAGVYLIVNLIVAIFFVRRRRVAPKLMVGYYIMGLAFGAFLGIGATVELGTSVNWGWFAFSSLLSALWITYFLVSKRVKATFVN